MDEVYAWSGFLLLLVQVASLSRYGAKGSISLQDSVKALHVLPFIPNFAALAAQIQAMLSEEPAAAHLPTPSEPCLTVIVLVYYFVLSLQCLLHMHQFEFALRMAESSSKVRRKGQTGSCVANVMIPY